MPEMIFIFFISVAFNRYDVNISLMCYERETVMHFFFLLGAAESPKTLNRVCLTLN